MNTLLRIIIRGKKIIKVPVTDMQSLYQWYFYIKSDESIEPSKIIKS